MKTEKLYVGYEHDAEGYPDAENASCFEPDAVHCTKHDDCKWHVVIDDDGLEKEVHVLQTK